MKPWLPLLASLALAACGGSNDNAGGDDGGGDDGPGPDASVSLCGNGDVDIATESCDDGNTTSGDGCSASCQTECGNGAIDGAEVCDDANLANGDGCSALCVVETGYTCVGTPSTCTAPSGTCASPFVVTFTTAGNLDTASLMGDTTGSTNQVPGAACDGFDTSGEGPDHIWAFTLAEAREVTIAIDETTSFDSVLRLTSTACDLTTEVPEAADEDGCSDNFDGEVLHYGSLPAGTYYVVIDGYDPVEVGTYAFTITTRKTECGNGFVEGAEECDDGNLDDDDRCSATCTLTYDVLEVEPNDTTPQVLTAGNHVIRGTLPVEDVDFFTFTLTAAATVQIETYDTIDPQLDYLGVGTQTELDCRDDVVELDTRLFLFGATGDLTDEDTALFDDDDDGDNTCSYLGPNDSSDVVTEGVLAAGTYTIMVRNYDPDVVADRYLVDLKITPTTPGGGTAVAPVAGDLVLNEVMAADATADTNCDAATTGTNDEFVELVNVSNHAVDLTGVTIEDAVITRHTFSNAATGSMTLAAGKAVVVWGGGAPACAGVTNWFVASTNQLGLNDAGDTITVKTAAGVSLLTHTYAASTAAVSSNRSPDVTGTVYANHSTVTGAVGNFSPGKKANATPF